MSAMTLSTKKSAHVAPIQRLDCTVKYKNAVPPPMNPPPICAVRVIPATMHEAVRSCSSMEIRSDGAILGFLSSRFMSSCFISSHSLFPLL